MTLLQEQKENDKFRRKLVNVYFPRISFNQFTNDELSQILQKLADFSYFPENSKHDNGTFEYHGKTIHCEINERPKQIMEKYMYLSIVDEE